MITGYHRLKAECERGAAAKPRMDTMTMEQIEARPATPPTVRSPSEEELRRELADAIDRRRAADTRQGGQCDCRQTEALMYCT
jgi:hypothetical protein